MELIFKRSLVCQRNWSGLCRIDPAIGFGRIKIENLVEYLLKARVKSQVGSKDCDLHEAFGQKAIYLDATADIFVVNHRILV